MKELTLIEFIIVGAIICILAVILITNLQVI